jgi:hypothetical protein
MRCLHPSCDGASVAASSQAVMRYLRGHSRSTPLRDMAVYGSPAPSFIWDTGSLASVFQVKLHSARVVCRPLFFRMRCAAWVTVRVLPSRIESPKAMTGSPRKTRNPQRCTHCGFPVWILVQQAFGPKPKGKSKNTLARTLRTATTIRRKPGSVNSFHSFLPGGLHQ